MERPLLWLAIGVVLIWFLSQRAKSVADHSAKAAGKNLAAGLNSVKPANAISAVVAASAPALGKFLNNELSGLGKSSSSASDIDDDDLLTNDAIAGDDSDLLEGSVDDE